jgi:phage gp29-like protein
MREQERSFVNYNIETLGREVATRDNCDWYEAGLGWLPDPDLVLRRMGLDARVYEELLEDPQVSAALTRRKAKTMIKKWNIDRNGAAVGLYETVKAVFDRLNIRKIMREMLDCVFFGCQPAEITWEDKEGMSVPVDVVGKPPHWFAFDSKNQLTLKTKKNFIGEPLPPRNFLVAKSDATFENPYGRRIAAQVFWYVIFKRNDLKWWVTFLEKFGMPWVIGKLPRGYSEQEEKDLLTMLSKMVRDAVAVIPENASVGLLSVGGSSDKGKGAPGLAVRREGARPVSGDAVSPGKTANVRAPNIPYLALVNYCDGAICKAFLGHSSAMDTLKGKVGGDNVIERAIDDLTDADASLICGVFNDLIDLFIEVNYPETAKANKPRFLLRSKKNAVNLALAERDKDLALSGKVRFTKKYLQRAYGFEDGDIVVTEEPPTAETALAQEDAGTILPPMPLSDVDRTYCAISPFERLQNAGER